MAFFITPCIDFKFIFRDIRSSKATKNGIKKRQNTPYKFPLFPVFQHFTKIMTHVRPNILFLYQKSNQQFLLRPWSDRHTKNLIFLLVLYLSRKLLLNYGIVIYLQIQIQVQIEILLCFFALLNFSSRVCQLKFLIIELLNYIFCDTK